MSYSFSVTADTKAKALEETQKSMAEVVQAQPIHARDQAQVGKTAEEVLALIAEPTADERVNIYVSGHLGWRGTYDPAVSDSPEAITSANLCVSTSIMKATD